MAYVDKVRRGIHVRFRARWVEPSGRQRAKSFDTRREAKEYAAEMERSMKLGSYVDPSLGKVLVKDFAEQWLADRDVRPSTAARDASYFRSMILPHFGDMPIGGVRPAEVNAWKIKLLSSHAPATVGKALMLLKKMMGDAPLPSNPIAKVKLPKVEREEMRCLDPAQITMLADAIHPRYKSLVLVGAYGGLRIGEMAGLQRQDIDFLRGIISVERQVVEIAGKLTIGPLKTKAAKRQVQVPRFVVDELAHHLGAGPTVGLVFPAPEGGLLSRTKFRQRFWVPAIMLCGLEGLRIHDLRHTAVSLWIVAGFAPNEVAAQAGHTSVRTVFDVYGHLLPGNLDAKMQRLEAMAQSGTGTGWYWTLPSRLVAPSETAARSWWA